MPKRLVMVVGQSASGKTSSLAGLTDHEKVLYLGTESGKGVNFKNKFKKKVITDPLSEMIGDNSYIRQAGAHPDKFNTIVIDSLTFLMRMFEVKYVKTASNTMQAWGLYGDFFDNLLNQEIPKLPQDVIITAHTSDVYNDKEMVTETRVKLKGSVMNIGVESYFNDIVACKKIDLKELEKYQNDLLHITENDELLGYKHVLQTRLTKETRNERIRSNPDMWDIKETYIDGNIQLVLNRLNDYYGD
jgi:hypothetical protein